MADHEPTLGEVYRLVLGVGHDLRDMRKDLVGRAEYEADQEGIDRRFQGSNETHTEMKADIAGVKAEALGGIKDLVRRMDESDKEEQRRKDDIEKEQRQNRSTRTFAIIMAVASAVLAVITPILLGAGGPS